MVAIHVSKFTFDTLFKNMFDELEKEKMRFDADMDITKISPEGLDRFRKMYNVVLIKVNELKHNLETF